jgi:hypothetical protein
LKINYLNKYIIKGSQASTVLDRYQDDTDNYDYIIDDLKRKYGNKRLLLSYIMKKLLFTPPAKDMSQARKTLDSIHAYALTLGKYHVIFNDPSSNLILLTVLESKFPPQLCQKWEEDIKDLEAADEYFNAPIPAKEIGPPLIYRHSVRHFLSFLETKISAIEQASAMRAHDRLVAGPAPVQQAAAPAAARQPRRPPPPPPQQQARRNRPPPKVRATAAVLAAQVFAAQMQAAQSARPAKPPPPPKPKNAGSSAKVTQPSGANKSNRPAPVQQAKNGTKPPKASNAFSSKYNYHITGCFFCGEGHSPQRCGTAHLMTAEERWHRFNHMQSRAKGGACSRCVVTGHDAKTCQKVCELCGAGHHRQMHNHNKPH